METLMMDILGWGLVVSAVVIMVTALPIHLVREHRRQNR